MYAQRKLLQEGLAYLGHIGIAEESVRDALKENGVEVEEKRKKGNDG